MAAILGQTGWAAWRRHVGAPGPEFHDRWFESARFVDRQGVLLRETPSELGQRGRPASLEDIGERILLASIVAEDHAFFAHDGIDRRALLRAIAQNVGHGRTVSGASTITQQLVKLLESRGQEHPRTLATKLWETARAQNLETRRSKAEILEAYMQRLPYGHGWVGPEAAAQGYFGRSSHQLSWAQASFLAVLPRAPSYLDPYRHRDRVDRRARALLDQLHIRGLLTDAEHERAANEPVQLRAIEHPFEAPAFVERLRSRDPNVHGPVGTTLDLALQRDVQGLVGTHRAAFARQLAHNAAVLVLDNATGDVLAYVASADFNDATIAGQVDMIAARRQPGSTIKPFVYALAFEQGHSPLTMLADVPTSFQEGPGQAYTPQNFHRGFVGPIPARDALAASLNIPPIRLAAEFEPGALLERLHRLGFASLDRDASHYGVALALGSGEVTLEELAAAYMALARDGLAIDPRKHVDDPPPRPRSVFAPSIAAAITDALADPLARLRLLGDQTSPFDIGFPVALKTGTSSGFRDAWTVGYTRERTVAVWMGNTSGAAMLEVTGSGGAGPLFADVMRRAMRDVHPAPLVASAHLRVVEVCPHSGHLPGPDCPAAVERRIPVDHELASTCPIHRRADPPRSPTDPWTCREGGRERIAVLPPEYDAWLRTLPPGARGRAPDDIPWIAAEHTEHCLEAPLPHPTLVVDEPQAGGVYWVRNPASDRVPVRAHYEGPLAARPSLVDWVVDGERQARVGPPYAATLELGPGDHRIYARPVDPRAAVRVPAVHFAVRAE